MNHNTDACKKPVSCSKLWTNKLLERLSIRLSPGSSQIEMSSEADLSACPEHYNYDIMIPLAHANKEEPLGWILFNAKYLQNELMSRQLQQYVAAKLPAHARIHALAALTVQSYCTGRPVSARSLRRLLDVSRGEHTKYHKANERLLNLLHNAEENYARLVRRFL